MAELKTLIGDVLNPNGYDLSSKEDDRTSFQKRI